MKNICALMAGFNGRNAAIFGSAAATKGLRRKLDSRNCSKGLSRTGKNET